MVVVILISNNNKVKLHTIFSENWKRFLEDPQIKKQIKNNTFRPAITKNVEKFIKCGNNDLGFSLYECPNCHEESFVFHTCKSRFCNSCGVQYAKRRATEISNKCFDVNHRQVVFTLPDMLWNYFRKDRSLLNIIFESAKETIFSIVRSAGKKKDELVPGVIIVMHTFGRSLVWNPHVHCLITEGGLSKDKIFKKTPYLNYESFRKRFMKILLYKMIDILGDSFRVIKNILYRDYPKGFYVNAPENKYDSIEKCIDYVVRYTGRPVMAESRIDDYSFELDYIKYHYIDHETEELVYVEEDIITFIKKMIVHIPDEQFKMVRYYGAYSAKNHKFRNAVKKMISTAKGLYMKSLTKHRRSLIVSFNKDPIKCKCGFLMRFIYSIFEIKRSVFV